jgi:hypothetical protein
VRAAGGALGRLLLVVGQSTKIQWGGDLSIMLGEWFALDFIRNLQAHSGIHTVRVVPLGLRSASPSPAGHYLRL